MSLSFTKGQIDRLGSKIREQSVHIDDETLDELQKYRIEHKEPISQVFTILCSISRTIHHSSITTFRIKRFESIIGKLERYPDMRFSRMWDIGGCRCILRSEEDLYKMKGLVESNKDLEVIKINDYVKEPQDSGYKSVHLYVKHKCSEYPIEVQLRTLENHDWATLVEITDLLFDTRLKELADNNELFVMHKFLSRKPSLSTEEKVYIFKTIKKYQFFEILSEVFARNYLRVRNQWLTMESNSSHKFFLIEASKKDVPKISAYSSFIEAEKNYFQMYKTSQNANIVLTYVQTHDYNLLAIAYANYILTFHSFMHECLTLFEGPIIEAIRNRNYFKFYKLYKFWNELAFRHSKNLISEIDEVVDNSFTQNGKRSKSKVKRKLDDWLKDIKRQVDLSNTYKRRLFVGIAKNMPKSRISKYVSELIVKSVDRAYKTRIRKVFKLSRAFNASLKKSKLK